MHKYQAEIEALGEKYRPQLERLDKMSLNYVTVNNLRFIHRKINDLSFSVTEEYFLEMDALTTAFCVNYGRLFSSTTGTTKLNPKDVPEEHQAAHMELIELRHERYAHHGNHESIDTQIALTYNGRAVTVAPRLDLGFYVGGSCAWGPLLHWLSEHMYQRLHEQLDHLTQISGVEWKIEHGPPPPWVQDDG